MKNVFDYKGTRDLLLILGVILSILAPLLGWLILIGAGLSFVIALTCHVSYVGQLIFEETGELRKRLKAIEDGLPATRRADAGDEPVAE